MWEAFISILIDVLLWLPRVLWSAIVDVLISFLSWLPTDAPDIAGAISGWPTDLLYFTTLFEVNYGFTVVFGSLFARFLLRRIPGIG